MVREVLIKEDQETPLQGISFVSRYIGCKTLQGISIIWLFYPHCVSLSRGSFSPLVDCWEVSQHEALIFKTTLLGENSMITKNAIENSAKRIRVASQFAIGKIVNLFNQNTNKMSELALHW